MVKSAIYINEGVTEVVLTPENEWEKSALKMVAGSSVKTYWGGFYECMGGWFRQQSAPDSLMFVIEKKLELPYEP